MGLRLTSTFSSYVDRILAWLNCLYVLWGSYFTVWFACFWSGWIIRRDRDDLDCSCQLHRGDDGIVIDPVRNIPFFSFSLTAFGLLIETSLLYAGFDLFEDIGYMLLL